MHEPFGMQDYSDGTSVCSLDPVCGKAVDEEKAAGKTGYAGQMYYFCSKTCQNNFELAPGYYIGQKE